jgi:Mrp family chromosome partitioning ATPase
VTESGLGFRVAHAIKKFLVNENRTGQANVVAVTSKGAKVGKTVITVGIASAAQVGGARVLLIDADYLAKERALRVQFSEGINDLQSGSQVRELASSFSALQKRQKINVWTLANEFMDESALTSFLVNDFGKVLEELRFSFDLIVVDCAPCFISSMLLIYEQADVNILCFAEGYSTLQDVEQLTEVVLPATKNGSAVFSVLTMAQLKNNVVSPRGSDGVYYRTVRAA